MVLTIHNALTVGQVGRQLGVPPRVITDLFYRGRLRDDLCPIVGGRRLIPPDYLPNIAVEVRRSGRRCDFGRQTPHQPGGGL